MQKTTFFTRFATSTLLAIALAGLSACGSESNQPVKVTGNLTYSGDRTLPKSATARVSMFEHREDGGDKRIVAERSLHELGKKPIEFDIDVARDLIDPEGRYGLRAEILDTEGNILWQTRDAATIKPLEKRDAVSLQLKPVLKESSLEFKKYQCDDGFLLSAAERDDRAIVKLGNRRLVLKESASGSGGRYTDEHNNSLDNSNDQMAVVIDDEKHANCKPFTETAAGGQGKPHAVGDPANSGITVPPEASAADNGKPENKGAVVTGNDTDITQKPQKAN